VSSLTIPPKIVAWRFGGGLLLFEVIILEEVMSRRELPGG
jgi:hypothetical protein